MIDAANSDVEFLGFALGDCTVNIRNDSVRYLRAVHRTALELAIQNQFGVEIGGFWLLPDQIAQLRTLPDYYALTEAPLVRVAVEAYLAAQLDRFYALNN